MRPVKDKELEAIVELCSKSIKATCQIFFPERFNRPFSKAHDRLFEVLDDESVKKVLTVAHRGFGKTSIFNYAVPAQAIIFKQKRFILPVSATSTLAEVQSENLKSTLTSSPEIVAMVGDLKSPNFSKEMWTTSHGVRVLPRGSGQQVRGLLYNDYRPDLIIPDDLEKSESVLSDEQRQKLKAWFFTDLMNCVDRSRSNWRILAVGTILHPSSLLSELRDDPTWTVLDFPLCDEEFHSCWVDFMKDSEVQALYEEYRSQNLVDEFYMEYMNIANPKETQVFKADMFHYYSEAEVDLNNDKEYENVIIVDPAKTDKPTSAYSAVVGVAIHHTSTMNAYYVRDVVNRHITTDELYRETFDMAERLNARVIGVEVTGLEEFIKKPVQDEMHRRGKNYELVWLKARTGQGDYLMKGTAKGKVARVGALVYYYRLGRVYHNPHVCQALETQLLNFPKPKNWDIMDALAYIIEMTELGERYWLPEHELADEEEELRLEERMLRDEEREIMEDNDLEDLLEVDLEFDTPDLKRMGKRAYAS